MDGIVNVKKLHFSDLPVNGFLKKIQKKDFSIKEGFKHLISLKIAKKISLVFLVMALEKRARFTGPLPYYAATVFNA